MVSKMKSVLISIQPRMVEKIASGEKTIEVRKTAPKQGPPFKCYIYCTKQTCAHALHLYINDGWGRQEIGITEHWRSGKEIVDVNPYLPAYRYNSYLAEGKVIGEFVCDKVFLLHPYTYDRGSADLERRKFIQTFEGSSKENEILAATCLTQDEMFDYIGAGNYGYGWHISDLKIYDKPKELSDFYTIDKSGSDCCIACVYHETPLEEMPCRTCTGERRYLYRPPQSWQYVEELEE